MKKAVLITGAARHLGREMAVALSQAGWDIALHYRTSRDEADALAEEIRQSGRRCELFACDLAEIPRVPALIEAVFAAFPECSALINNASIFDPGGFLETDEQKFDHNFAVNFKAPFFLTQQFALRCQRGCVVNMLDTRVARTITDHFAYTLAKKAMWELTKMSARVLAPGIRVNAIAPGLILPPDGSTEAGGRALVNRLTKRIPMQTHGSAADITAATLFLLDNPFITGETIFVDGGESLR